MRYHDVVLERIRQTSAPRHWQSQINLERESCSFLLVGELRDVQIHLHQSEYYNGMPQAFSLAAQS